MDSPDRRQFLQLSGVAALTTLAGCSNGEDPDEGKPRVSDEPNYRGWFNGVSNYDSTIDARGQSEVTVKVGSQGNNGYFAYAPPAVAVSPGTEVRWEWTGDGGAHDVSAEQGAFDSGEPVRNPESPFTYTFDSPAIYKYFCTPHRTLGMRGAVFVALGQEGGP